MQSTLSFSPSFNTYSSSDRLAQIAARVVSEFRQELGEDDAVWESIDDYDQFNNFDADKDTQFTQPKSTEVQQQQQPQNDVVKSEDDAEDEDEEDEEEEFEFAFVSKEPQASPISADDVFYNGQIRPVYPVFDQKLLLDDDNPDVKISEKTATETTTKQRRLPLRMLMIEEERETASCSSSEADDLENLPPGTYCVWAPPKAADKSSRSSSTGSSKRWKFRDLLSRSSSDGGAKETFVFFPPPAPSTTASKGGNKGDGNTAARKSGKGASEEGDKRRTSYLPYRQDLVGFFSNVNGLSRNLHPF